MSARRWPPARTLNDAIKLAIAALFVLSCSQSSALTPAPAQVSMNAADWIFLYSVGIPAHPSQTGKGWTFDFPGNTTACPGPIVVPGPSDCPQVDYVLTASPILKATQTVSMSAIITTSGNPHFNYFTQNDGSQPGKQATCRLFFQERGDNLSAKGAYAYYRWWSLDAASIVLAPGSFNISAVLDPALWVSVGNNDQPERVQGFAQAMANAQNIGFTCGGHFYGHGVNIIGGSAGMNVTDYKVQ